MKKYEFHRLAQGKPLMLESDAKNLAESIKKNGQLIPIGLFEGKILDGRNRYLACMKVGVAPHFEKVSIASAKAYVTAMNFDRQHLTPKQKDDYLRYLIAAQDAMEMTNAEVAQVANVSESTVKRAKRKSSKKGSKRGGLTPPVDNGEVQIAPEPITDDMGYPVPVGNAQSYWARRTEALNVLNQIKAARGQVTKLSGEDVMWSNVNLNGVLGRLNEAINMFEAGVPAHVCVDCDGVRTEDCPVCRGKGVISKFVFHHQSSAEPRRKREAWLKEHGVA